MPAWSTIAPWAATTVVLWVILAATARWAAGRRKRLFTWDQKELVQRVAGPLCTWRSAHLPQGVAAAYLVLLSHANPTIPALWITAAVLAVLAGKGLPITRTAGRCSGPLQGGHQWAATHGGSTSIWNIEMACESCNRDQSDRWSWRYAAGQWGPWTLAIYAWRWTRLNALLAWHLGTSTKAREAVKDARTGSSTAVKSSRRQRAVRRDPNKESPYVDW